MKATTARSLRTLGGLAVLALGSAGDIAAQPKQEKPPAEWTLRRREDKLVTLTSTPAKARGWR
jgi:hypothetical protein